MAPTSLHPRAAQWLAHDPDPRTRAELETWLSSNDERLARAFSGRIRFGTAGLRAEVGVGPLQMNALVVRQTVAGLARVLARHSMQGFEVAVGFDGRLDSQEWAHHAVGVLRAFGHPVALFDAPVPTPLVGFWVKQHRLAAGIVITASHNPPKDNGIKVYWTGGAQIAPPIDATIASAIDLVASDEDPVPFLPREAPGPAVRTPRQSAMDSYATQLERVVRAASTADTAPIRVAYTPLHGVGFALVDRVLKEAPVAAFVAVASQKEPDGHFPTLASPNPEDPNSLRALLELAANERSDVACANDPDADRLAIAARREDGAMEVMTGDELGVVLADALLRRAPQPARCALASSCVSSRLLRSVCRAFGATHRMTLPGFKWLAQAMQAAQQQAQTPLFAYEEALGFMSTTLAWDKDGVSALRLVVQLAAEHRARGASLYDALRAVHVRYGLSVTGQATFAIATKSSAGGASQWMQALRAAPLERLGAYRVTSLDDGQRPDVGTAFATLPKSDALALWLSKEGEATSAHEARLRVLIRPSGTEPKLKVYLEIVEAAPSEATWATRRRVCQDELRTLRAQLEPLVLGRAP